jgi:hypothetical protein
VRAAFAALLVATVLGGCSSGAGKSASASAGANSSESASSVSSETSGSNLGGSGQGGNAQGSNGQGTSSSAATGGQGGTVAAASNGSGGASAGSPSGSGGSGGAAPADDPLGAYPVDPSPVTLGGTMTFTNVGAPGLWPRRLDRESGDPACDYKDGTDTWGGQCCMTEHTTESSALSPFDEEMTLIVKAIDIKQLAIYQPAGDSDAASWQRVTAWDSRSGRQNLWFTDSGDGCSSYPGDLTQNDCVGYVMQQPELPCSQLDYYCPNDPGMLHQGFAGSKLVMFLGSMTFYDGVVGACDGDGAGHPGPWVAFVASELVRDGGRKWNGLCNCYSKTDSVGDGCGEINVFEVVMDNNDYSNREFASTGVRSFQEGHVGGAVCTSSCQRDDFPSDADVVDACAGAGYSEGPVLDVGGATDGCPVWVRPNGDRYFFILLDETERTIQVGMIHPDNIPAAASGVLPEFASAIDRSTVDALRDLRLPSP